MSLGNSSSSSSKQEYNTTTKNLNVQGVEGLAVAGLENSTVNLTDGGAIEKMADVSISAISKNIDFGKSAFDKAFAFVNKSNSDALGVAERASRNAMQIAADAASPEAGAFNKQLYVMAAVVTVTVAVVAFVVVKK